MTGGRRKTRTRKTKRKTMTKRLKGRKAHARK
jgi:hypothetical protein